ncbi:DNA-binding protein [Pseudomonas sp. NPDC090202]|uniref:DNA-binding protein n=1 Tax=unclassified Pseudomonas TaxID=196821 RepID=UPI003815F087
MTLVTQKQVRQAVNSLTAQGRVPTPKSISEHLGGGYSAASIKAQLTALAKEASRPIANQTPPPTPVRPTNKKEQHLVERLRMVEFALYRLKQALDSECRENEKLRERLTNCQNDLTHAELKVRTQQSALETLEDKHQCLQETARISEAQFWELYLLRAALADLAGKRLAYERLRIRPTVLLWPERFPLTPENPTSEHPVVITAMHRVSQYEESLRRDYGDKQTQTALLTECENLKLKLRAQEYLSTGIRADLEKCRERLFKLTQKKTSRRSHQSTSDTTEKIDLSKNVGIGPPETNPRCGFWRVCGCRYGLCQRAMLQMASLLALHPREMPPSESDQENDDDSHQR